MSQVDGLGYPITDWYQWKVGGQIAGNVAVTACPSQACKWVKFKAAHDNAGLVAVGPSSGLTLPDNGADNTTCGWPLAAGEETDWMPAPSGNLSGIYNIAANAGDDLLWKYLE